MPTSLNRASFGFVAAVISVLVFHQGMWELLHLIGLMPPWYPTRGVPPFGVPLIIDLCFWGGVWGAVFGLALPRLPAYQMWFLGLGLGIVAALVGLFIVPLIKGLPVAGGWAAMAFVRSFLINGCWGIGVGLILPLLTRRLNRNWPDCISELATVPFQDTRPTYDAAKSVAYLSGHQGGAQGGRFGKWHSCDNSHPR